MSTTNAFHPELLRPVDHVFEPDPRNLSFVKLDRDTGNFIPLDIRDHHKGVSEYQIHSNVPEDIAIQFETTKTLYLYAWYIYRFYPVSEFYALACLELALREKYGKEIPKKYFPRSEKPTLKPLLRYSIDCGYIRNEGFRKWHETVELRARSRYRDEKLKEMREKGLNKIDLDYSEVEITDVDKNLEYRKILLELLPELRNHYAHGTGMLYMQVLATIEVVAEIINQIYSDSSKS